jgi:hypothetical protein
MARLTAEDMVDMVRDSLGGETSETLSDTRVLRYINQSYLELCSQYQFDQLSTSTTVTTTSGTAEYELSVSNVMQIIKVVDDTNNFMLYTMNESQYHQFTQGNTTSGAPVYWFIDGVGSNDRYNMKLYPTPNATLSLIVYYTQSPDELVLSPTATSPVIPEPWDDSIVYRAVSRGWMMLGDPDTAIKWRQMAKANDQSAYRSTYHPTQLIDRPRSIVGMALRNA